MDHAGPPPPIGYCVGLQLAGTVPVLCVPVPVGGVVQDVRVDRTIQLGAGAATPRGDGIRLTYAPGVGNVARSGAETGRKRAYGKVPPKTTATERRPSGSLPTRRFAVLGLPAGMALARRGHAIPATRSQVDISNIFLRTPRMIAISPFRAGPAP